MKSIDVDGQVVTVGDWFAISIRTFGPYLGCVGRVTEVDEDDTGQVIEVEVEGSQGSFRQRINAIHLDHLAMVDGPLEEAYDWEAFEK